MEHTGVVCGRFQIFHNEHLQYVMAAKEQCEHLIVGIASPDPIGRPELVKYYIPDDWKQYVPNATYEYIVANGIDKRIIELMK